jgi:hypothetical protein
MRLLISSLVFLLPAVALAAPGIPEAFHGTASGAVGASIVASIAGMAIASTTIESGGVYGYAPHLFFVPDAFGDRVGATVTFAIGDASAEQSTAFANGAITELNLTLPGSNVSSASSTPAAITAPSTSASGGAPSAASKSAPPIPVLITSPWQFDMTGDRKTDLADFAFVLAHWGLAGQGTSADINKDGIVDLLDFNLLISHWTL